MTAVAITGATGLLGRRLAATLAASPRTGAVVGVVGEPPEDPVPGVEYREADVRGPELAEALRGAGTVVHLALQPDPMRDELAMRALNVEGSRNVCEATAAVGAGKIVHLSSGVVYGAHPDNDFPLVEDSPLRANPGFSFAEHVLEVERWLWDWAQDRDAPALTVLRPSVVGGAGVDNFLTRQIEAPRFVTVRGHRPPLQFVHVDDLVAALVRAVEADLPGAYNVSAEGWLSFDEAMAVSGSRPLEVPEEVAFTLADRLWRWRVSDYPPGAIHYAMYPWVLSVEKLLGTGWRPRHSNRDALVQLVEEHVRFVSVGGVRTTRRRARAWGAGVVGVAAAVAGVWALRRRAARGG